MSATVRTRATLVLLSTLTALGLLAPTAAAADGRLAATGADVTWIVVGAIAVVVIGVAALLLSRRARK